MLRQLAAATALFALTAGAALAEPRWADLDQALHRQQDDPWYQAALAEFARSHPAATLDVICLGVRGEGLNPRLSECTAEGPSSRDPAVRKFLRTVERRARPVSGLLGEVKLRFQAPAA